MVSILKQLLVDMWAQKEAILLLLAVLLTGFLLVSLVSILAVGILLMLKRQPFPPDAPHSSPLLKFWLHRRIRLFKILNLLHHRRNNRFFRELKHPSPKTMNGEHH